MDRIYEYNLTTTSGGNLSIRDAGGEIWITPARLDKGSLRRTDIACVLPDGTVEGPHKPSSELPFHREIYDARPDLGAIIHAHPGALVSFSICGQVPDTHLFPESRRVCGEVAFAKYALPGSIKLAEHIATAFAAPSQPHCVLLENHGVVIGGTDLEDAFARFETLEFTAAILLNAKVLGKVRLLTDAQLALAETPREPLPESDFLAVTSLEKERRKEICDFIGRAYHHRLMTSTHGSYSARVGHDHFVITPFHFDRRDLGLADLVSVHAGHRAPGSHPSRAVQLHRAIYREHPELNAVLNALPVSATAFAVSDFPLDTRTIPESYLFLKDVRKIPYSEQFGDGTAIAKHLTSQNPVVLLENNGAMVAGRTVLDAFDRLEVLEATSQAILRSRALGPLRPMSNEVIGELVDAFPSV